jgi:hypothetical protein
MFTDLLNDWQVARSNSQSRIRSHLQVRLVLVRQNRIFVKGSINGTFLVGSPRPSNNEMNVVNEVRGRPSKYAPKAKKVHASAKVQLIVLLPGPFNYLASPALPRPY